MSPAPRAKWQNRLVSQIDTAIRDVNAILLTIAERYGVEGVAACADLICDYYAAYHGYHSTKGEGGAFDGEYLHGMLDQLGTLVGRAVDTLLAVQYRTNLASLAKIDRTESPL